VHGRLAVRFLAMNDSPWEALAAAVREYAADDEHADDVATLLADLVALQVREGRYARFFRPWEARGLHLTPVHFYSPIPDTRLLPPSLWDRESDLPGVDLKIDSQLELVRDVFPRYRSEYARIPIEPTGSERDFYLSNTIFGGMDALSLYCMIRHFQPRLVVEVGSGMSSRLIAQAAECNEHTELVSIDPYPDSVVRGGLPGRTSLIPKRVEEVDLDVFGRLESNDVLFIDSSHVVRCGGDVNYLFLEVIPRLAPGVIVHVHDVFLPREYPEKWMKEELRFWSEQYLLQAFLAFNTEFEVLLTVNLLSHHHWRDLAEAFPNARGGGSFWMRRRSEASR